MALKSLLLAVVCIGLSASAGLAAADQYRPDEFLGLDLSKAVLSPKPLGPPIGFTPGPLDEKVDRGEPAQAGAEPAAKPKIAKRRTAILHPGAKELRGAVRTRLARHYRNPLDAQAFDTRIQVWPCRAGGICNWKRPAN